MGKQIAAHDFCKWLLDNIDNDSSLSLSNLGFSKRDLIRYTTLREGSSNLVKAKRAAWLFAMTVGFSASMATRIVNLLRLNYMSAIEKDKVSLLENAELQKQMRTDKSTVLMSSAVMFIVFMMANENLIFSLAVIILMVKIWQGCWDKCCTFYSMWQDTCYEEGL